MIAEAPFFFSIAALSASLAALAGLVAGLRRGTDMPREDLFRASAGSASSRHVAGMPS